MVAGLLRGRNVGARASPIYCEFVAALSPEGFSPPRLMIDIVSRQRSARPIRSTARRQNRLMESALALDSGVNSKKGGMNAHHTSGTVSSAANAAAGAPAT